MRLKGDNMFHDLPFMMYVLEQEGELDTPLGKRNKLIKELRLRAQWYPIDESEVIERAAAVGLGILTDEEINDIINEVNMG